MNPSSIPKAPLVLGLSGLVPFWGLMLAMAMQSGGFAPDLGWGGALATYGAVIVSFLGGIRWGLATVAPGQGAVGRHYAIAVIPSLLAWAALALPLHMTLAALGLVALALGWVDRGLVEAGLAPAWFGRLRMILSGGAGAALLLAALIAGFGHA